MRTLESAPGWEPIDVYSDVSPGHAQRFRGQRRQPIPAPTGALEHGYRDPTLPTAPIDRPAIWAENSALAESVLHRLEEGLDAEALTVPKRRSARMVGTAVLLDWLARYDGDSWQHRWLAAGLDDAAGGWAAQVTDPRLHAKTAGRHQLLQGASALVVLDVIRPSYRWLHAFRSPHTWAQVRAERDPDGFARLAALARTLEGFSVNDENLAFAQLARILCHSGGRLADISVADCREAFLAQLAYTVRQQTLWYWLLLHDGVLGDDAPRHAHALHAVGQRSVTDLVDGYRVEHPAVRGLLIDYLHERQAGLDYSSLAQLASKLVLLFWRDLELHEPGIDSLHLPDDVARRWKERLRVVTHGKHRVGRRREDPNTILLAVRAFYADINHWATQDPARWARWAAPNPISARDLIGQNKQKHRARARMQQRTRELAPLIPALAQSADRQRRHASELLTAGRAAAHDDAFTVNGETLVRVVPPADPTNGGNGRPGLVWADTLDGTRRNLGFEDDRVFWGWAIIEVLRHTGIRIEELTELTHRSFVAYTLPSTGETIPLLQVTPSKTDRERLLVVSPDLGEVLATIINRVRNGRDQLPLLRRYDHAERLHSPPLPFLFQRRHGLVNVMITPSHAGTLIHRIVAASGLSYSDGTPLQITPHDFRRVFATDAVAAGLPVHIAAKVLGHEHLTTTQAYVAVYDRDVIEHHRAFIARRRALRPAAEYRDVTDDEWDEFLAHFEKRKVELGICGRAYATPCIHEHACLRCPLLRPDPRQHDRLTEIHTNLLARLEEAHTRAWAGEIEGLHISITAAEQKLDRMRRTLAEQHDTTDTPPP